MTYIRKFKILSSYLIVFKNIPTKMDKILYLLKIIFKGIQKNKEVFIKYNLIQIIIEALILIKKTLLFKWSEFEQDLCQNFYPINQNLFDIGTNSN